MAWRLAPCLEALRDEVDALAPDRSRDSDGTIGDTAHGSRESDHNPDDEGWVDAIDLTHDPAHGADMNSIVGRVIANRDERVSYVIWNGGLWRSYAKPGVPAWTRQDYTGANPHDHHAHFSARDENRHDTTPWLEDDMPLTDDDARKIADAVGGLVIRKKNDGTKVNLRTILLDMQRDLWDLQRRVERLEAD